MNVRYALFCTPYSREVRRSSQPCASHSNMLIHVFLAKFARISHEYLHFSDFFSYAGAMALLAAPPPSGRGRPEAIPPGRAHQCSCTAGHGRPRVLRRALEFGRRPARRHPAGRSRAPPSSPGPRPRGRRKPGGRNRCHGLPVGPPPHRHLLHAAVPAPVRMEAGPPGTEAGKGGVRGDNVGDRGGDAGWGAGAAPQNVLPLRHHLPEPRGRLEGVGEDDCPLRIPAAWRALEDGLLRAG